MHEEQNNSNKYHSLLHLSVLKMSTKALSFVFQSHRVFKIELRATKTKLINCLNKKKLKCLG